MLSGLCFGIATILRPSSIIILIACILFSIWKLFLQKFKDWKKIIAIVIIISTIGVGTIKAFDFTMIKTEQVPNSAISNNAKYFKFVMGICGVGILGYKPTLDPEKTWIYYDLQAMDFDYDRYNELCKSALKDLLLNDTNNRVKYISDKMVIFGGGKDNQIAYLGNDVAKNNLPKLMDYYGYVQYILLLILTAIITFLTIIKRKDFEYKEKNEHWDSILKIAFIGYFLVHIFIEVQTRYRYEQYFMLAIISAPCLSIIFDKIEKLWNKLKKEKINLEKIIKE